MKNHGLQDILVAFNDNLTGMSDAIEAFPPKTQHQLCIVHQIRNSFKICSSLLSSIILVMERYEKSRHEIKNIWY